MLRMKKVFVEIDGREYTYYDVLGVTEGAAGEEIKGAHRRLISDLHPDHKPGPYQRSFEEFAKTANAAKDVLLNPDKRRAYDLALGDERKRRERGNPGEVTRESAPATEGSAARDGRSAGGQTGPNARAKRRREGDGPGGRHRGGPGAGHPGREEPTRDAPKSPPGSSSRAGEGPSPDASSGSNVAEDGDRGLLRRFRELPELAHKLCLSVFVGNAWILLMALFLSSGQNLLLALTLLGVPVLGLWLTRKVGKGPPLVALWAGPLAASVLALVGLGPLFLLVAPVAFVWAALWAIIGFRRLRAGPDAPS